MNATTSSGQSDVSAAKPRPVAAISTAAASSRRRSAKRCPQRPTASVASAEPSERRGADETDLELAKPEREQVGGQEHRHEAVGERAQRRAASTRRAPLRYPACAADR